MNMSAKLTLSVPEWLDRFCTWPLSLYRKHKYGFPFRKIFLGDGLFTILDQQDYYRYAGFNWTLGGHGTKFYAVRVLVDGDDLKTLRLHREIMNPPAHLVVDHWNTDSLDNRRENLRIVTQAENLCNRRKRKNTTSRYIGVWFAKEKNKWESRITHKGKKIYLGSFDNEIDAAKAYDRAAFQLRGKFARLNFPQDYANAL
jgi:hypothetical protein